MSKNHDNLSLHPDHLTDLRKSGLSDEIIQEAGIYSVRPADINKKLGFNDPRIESVMAIPYGDDFERFKIFPPQDGKKYIQLKGSENHLYLPDRSVPFPSDQSIPINITEGEKKALRLCQEGVFCAAIGGLWNWCRGDGNEEKSLIPDFDLIDWKDRTVYLIPDNDWLQPDHHGERRNLRQAVHELAYRLIDRGARVYVIELPPGPLKGLDNYLCQHSTEEFRALPKREVRKQTIEEAIQEASLDTLRDILKRLATFPETERAVHVNALAKKLSIPKGSIKKDIALLLYKKSGPPDIERLLEDGANPESQFSAQNYIDGVLSYGAILGKERILIKADGEIILADGTTGDSFRFKRSSLTPETIKRFRAGEDVDGRDLLNRIRTLIIDHVVFKDDRIPTLLGVWIIGTYMFKLFRFYGYLWINSPVKRCGKSLLLDIISFIAFNATSRLVDPSPAFLFREVHFNDDTLILDEIESLGSGDKEKKSELIGLLNSGFQRGAQAPRLESKNREFIVTFFNAYGPKALAGIKALVDTLEDRSFKIGMVRKTKSEIIKRFNLRTLDSQIEKIREDCFLWALRYAGDVAEVYAGEQESEFPGIQNLDDRLKDILEPLLSIASVVDAQVGDEIAETVKIIVSLAQAMGKGRDDQEALNGSIPAVVNLLKTIVDGVDERFISADDLFSKFQGDEDLGFIQSKRGLSFFLSKLDLYRTLPRWIEGKTTRGYLVTRRWLEDLERRYV